MSPTVFEDRGYRVMIFSSDHPPAHIHVLKGDKRARLYLSPVAVWENNGFSPAEIREIIDLVRSHKGHCWKIWHELHGTMILLTAPAAP
jgi:uncharacterized protein DUF4160